MSSLNIPQICGVMPLPDCTLFPHGGMPLHIYEHRYRQMLAETLDDSFFFAVAMLDGKESADLANCTRKVGTIGLIRTAQELDDGTSHLLLHGVIRVHFREWIDDSPYPKARIAPIPNIFQPKSQSAAALEALRETAEFALHGLPEEIHTAFTTMISSIHDPATLADVIAQQFIHQPEERQQLLETESPAARTAWLCQKLCP